MQWALALLAVAILGVAAIAASGRFEGLPPVVDDTPAPYIPEGELTAATLREVRFTVETRGYAMQQVDALLAQLAAQMTRTAERSPDLSPATGDNGENARIDRSSEWQR
ncbi:DivIVA domain-containing protein [Propionicicella superfundia]|uniref:DivIVA domain-containing protein n=1 Tax=Propionicicella superfundia TaxID=348582 RepID=UPI000419A624|nr:DivIVA domain-containing protein [Propionicicella superfundia]